MAKQFSGGRRNRNTSFGKRQDADDAFRKKKKEGGRSDERRSDSRGSSDRRSGTGSSGAGRSDERRSPRGSSYEGGKRNFSAGRSDEKRPYRSGSSDRKDERPFRGTRSDSGSSRSFGDKRSGASRPSGRSFGKPYEKREPRSFDKPFEKRDPRSSSDKPYEKREPRSFDKPYEKREPRSSDRPFRGDKDQSRSKRSYGDKPSFKKPYKTGERKSFVESKIDSHRERADRPQTEEGKVSRQPKEDGLIRLNKFISNSGVCSRREADDLIKMGVISVNGTTITEMGFKVKPTDDVRHEGKRLTAEKPVYILLNKPKGFITTTDDPQERNTVMQLIAGACKERVYPVGRLDRNTTGLLLLTNDGELTDKLTHPSFNAKKIYKVELDKPITKADFQRVVDGVVLEEGKAMVDDVAIVSDDGKTVGIELHIGWNHVVRRIFNALEYDVVKLDRVVYAGLDKTELKRGQWRFLKTDEIVRLKHFK